jgi:hemerythrin
MAIEWKDSLTLHVPVLDRQHRELVGRASAVIAAMRAGRGASEIEGLFKYLNGYVRTHFAAEEALMGERGYLRYEQHAEQHAALTERLHALHDRFMSEGATLPLIVALNTFVCTWFFDHIAGSDRAIATWLNERGRESEAPAVPDARGNVESPTSGPERGELEVRVLVVDDEAGVGKVIGRILAPLKTVFVQSPAGALGRLGAGGQFVAIVCDVNMPGMNGMQLHDEVTKLDPELAGRFVYVTGYAPSPAFATFLERTRCACLEKPIEEEVLRATVAATTSRKL